MPRVGLTKEQYVRIIKTMLADRIVIIEAGDEIIGEAVDIAFLELKNYISERETLTIPYSNEIDVSPYNIDNVVQIMRADGNDKGDVGIGGIPLWYTRRNSLDTSYGIHSYAQHLMRRQQLNTISTDLSFHFEKRSDKLYVSAQLPTPGLITIVFTRDYKDVAEIIEPYWQNLLKRLSLAFTKEILARARGKYVLQSATYKLDAEQLIQEALEEIREIRTFLNTNTNLILPLD